VKRFKPEFSRCHVAVGQGLQKAIRSSISAHLPVSSDCSDPFTKHAEMCAWRSERDSNSCSLPVRVSPLLAEEKSRVYRDGFRQVPSCWGASGSNSACSAAESVLLSSRAIGSATIRRAHAIHPPGAVQIEYSLWTRDVAAEILSLCKELEDQLIDPQTGAILRTIEANRFVTEISWINGTSEGRHPLSAARAGLGRAPLSSLISQNSSSADPPARTRSSSVSRTTVPTLIPRRATAYSAALTADRVDVALSPETVHDLHQVVASVMRLAARPVGAHGNRLTPLAARTRKIELTMVVLPTPGPPVMTSSFDKRANRIAAT
jgi:hypothetical protein